MALDKGYGTKIQLKYDSFFMKILLFNVTQVSHILTNQLNRYPINGNGCFILGNAILNFEYAQIIIILMVVH